MPAPQITPGAGGGGQAPYSTPGSISPYETNRFGESIYYRPGQQVNDQDQVTRMFDNPSVLNRHAMEHTGKRLAPWGRARNLFEQNVAPGLGMLYSIVKDMGDEGPGDHGGSDIIGFSQDVMAQLVGQGGGDGFNLGRDQVMPFLQEVFGEGRNRTAEAMLYHNKLDTGADNVISLLGTATFSIMDPFTRGAFMSRLEDARDQWEMEGEAAEQTFVDYLIHSGFLTGWGIL